MNPIPRELSGFWRPSIAVHPSPAGFVAGFERPIFVSPGALTAYIVCAGYDGTKRRLLCPIS